MTVSKAVSTALSFESVEGARFDYDVTQDRLRGVIYDASAIRFTVSRRRFRYLVVDEDGNRYEGRRLRRVLAQALDAAS